MEYMRALPRQAPLRLRRDAAQRSFRIWASGRRCRSSTGTLIAMSPCCAESLCLGLLLFSSPPHLPVARGYLPLHHGFDWPDGPADLLARLVQDHLSMAQAWGGAKGTL
jgi:hypothetical protein